MVVRVDAVGVKKTSDGVGKMIDRIRDMTPANKAAAAMMRTFVDDRFKRETAPDGQRWPDHSPVTLQMRLTRTKGGRSALATVKRQDERDAARGKQSKRATKARQKVQSTVLGAKLLQDRGRLRNSAFARGKKKWFEFGAKAKYAAAQHFGNPKNRLPNTSGGNPAPIPARQIFPVEGGGNRFVPVNRGPSAKLWTKIQAIYRNWIVNGKPRP